MLPKFDRVSGHLPKGIHDASWADVEKSLGFNSTRQHLLTYLKRAALAFRAAGLRSLYIDGSFASEKFYPGDIDGCYDSSKVDAKLLDPVLLNFEDRDAMKKAYKGEYYPALLNTGRRDFEGNFLQLFQRDKQSHKPKGIIALDLETVP